MGNLHHLCAGRMCVCSQHICCPRAGHENWWGYCVLSNHQAVALCMRNDLLAGKVQSNLGKSPIVGESKHFGFALLMSSAEDHDFHWGLFYSDSGGILHQCSAPGALAPLSGAAVLLLWLLPVEPLFSCCDSSQWSHCSPSSGAADLPPWLLPVEPLFSCCGSYRWLISGCRSIWF